MAKIVLTCKNGGDDRSKPLWGDILADKAIETFMDHGLQFRIVIFARHQQHLNIGKHLFGRLQHVHARAIRKKIIQKDQINLVGLLFENFQSLAHILGFGLDDAIEA